MQWLPLSFGVISHRLAIRFENANGPNTSRLQTLRLDSRKVNVSEKVEKLFSFRDNRHRLRGYPGRF